jgi:hypothetical protein
MRVGFMSSWIIGREIKIVVPDSKSINLQWVVRQSFCGCRGY